MSRWIHPSRLASLVMALTFLGFAYAGGGGEAALSLAAFLVPLSECIWFSEALGGYTGAGMTRSPITAASPSALVAVCGWLLLLPLAMVLIARTAGSPQDPQPCTP
jgi:uncharacterized membrane protein YoaT (DUF817 family)